MEIELNKFITNWLVENYGKSEAEEPCYNLGLFIEELLKNYEITKRD